METSGTSTDSEQFAAFVTAVGEALGLKGEDLEDAQNHPYENLLPLVADAGVSHRNRPSPHIDSEPRHPTYGTLRQLDGALRATLNHGQCVRMGHVGALAWFAEAYQKAEPETRTAHSEE
jgi:hypothetical protein